MEADKSADEFIYDTSAPDSFGHNVATMRGIAIQNGIIIPDNLRKSKDIASRLATELIKLKLPVEAEMTEESSKTERELALETVLDGIDKGLCDEDIMCNMLNEKLTFLQVPKLFKSIMEEQGHRITSKDRVEKIYAILKKMKFKPINKGWPTVQRALLKIIGGKNEDGDEISATVPDTSEKQAINVMKKFCKEAELAFPKAPRSAAKGKSRVYEFMINNPGATKEEFSTFMFELNKNEKTIDRFWEFFQVAVQMAENLNGPAASAKEAATT
ncbi:MAG: hypothetical protein JKY33_10715 [Bacteroidia bacterium]|nr:hypothetical protein [Bacteroidia bacterium]